MSEVLIDETESRPTFQFAIRRHRRYKQPRLKITTHALALTIPARTDIETELRYRRISAGLALRCTKEGIPGTLYGTFGKYDEITLTHQGRSFLHYIDREQIERDREAIKKVLQETYDQLVAEGKIPDAQRLVEPATDQEIFDVSGFGG